MATLGPYQGIFCGHLTSMNTSSFYFDSEPERMTSLARGWWFGAIVGTAVLLCAGVGVVLWFTLQNQSGITTEVGSTARPEQKLLNRTQLDDVIHAYEERVIKSQVYTDAPLKDPSK